MARITKRRTQSRIGNDLHLIYYERTMTKVAMIGVGKLGQACAEVMADTYPLVGYDVAPREPKNFPMWIV